MIRVSNRLATIIILLVTVVLVLIWIAIVKGTPKLEEKANQRINSLDKQLVHEIDYYTGQDPNALTESDKTKINSIKQNKTVRDNILDEVL